MSSATNWYNASSRPIALPARSETGVPRTSSMAATRVSARRARKQKRTVNGERRQRPQKGAVHGILLGVLLWSIVLFLYYAGGAVLQTNLVEGQRARNTLVATVGFSYPDLALTELLKRQAADSVLPVFAIDPVGYNTATRTLNRLYEKLEVLQSDSAATNQSDTAITEALYADITRLGF